MRRTPWGWLQQELQRTNISSDAARRVLTVDSGTRQIQHDTFPESVEYYVDILANGAPLPSERIKIESIMKQGAFESPYSIAQYLAEINPHFLHRINVSRLMLYAHVSHLPLFDEPFISTTMRHHVLTLLNAASHLEAGHLINHRRQGFVAHHARRRRSNGGRDDLAMRFISAWNAMVCDMDRRIFSVKDIEHLQGVFDAVEKIAGPKVSRLANRDALTSESNIHVDPSEPLTFSFNHPMRPVTHVVRMQRLPR